MRDLTSSTVVTKLLRLPRLHRLGIVACMAMVIALALTPQAHRLPEQTETDPINITLPIPDTATLFEPDQHDTLSPAQPSLSLQVSSGDSLSTLFDRAELTQSQLIEFMQDPAVYTQFGALFPGDHLHFHIDQQTVWLDELVLQKSKLLQYSAKRDQQGDFTLSRLERTPDIQIQSASVTILSSLFLDAEKSGLSNSLIITIAQIFGWDIDFALDIRQGDQFHILYEELYLDGEKYKDGEILAARFVNNGKTYTAIRYQTPDGQTRYYTPQGKSMRKTFLRTPVDFARISSHFDLKRKHPVLHKIRAHKGTDYAAPRGTQVKAAGDGKVIFIGTKGGYGRTVILQHGQAYTTLYAHLNGYHKSIKQGKKVGQGDIIGYVGSTGMATGPHLHYEFRINGAHKNPVTVKLPAAQPIAPQYKADFLTYASQWENQLDALSANANF